MRTRRSYFPPTDTIPRRSRRQTTNVVEPEIRTIVEMADNCTMAQMTDYSLWEIILNSDSPVPTRLVEGVAQPVAPTNVEQKLARKNELKARGVVQPLAPTIAEQKLARKNELKARDTLLMALPDKH
nr:hypothetical protein [Tanacetum cinerariifolium]